jgi:hypothetical protein
MKLLVDLALQLSALESTHASSISTASFKFPDHELVLVRVPPGLSYAFVAESHGILLGLDGLGSVIFPGWRATFQQGQVTDITTSQRVEIAADGDSAFALLVTRALAPAPALEEKTPPPENRLAPPEVL